MSGQDAEDRIPWAPIRDALVAAKVPLVAIRYAAFLHARWLWRTGGECRESRASLAADFLTSVRHVSEWELVLRRSGLFESKPISGRYRSLALTPASYGQGLLRAGPPTGRGTPASYGQGPLPPTGVQTQETQEKTQDRAREARWDVVLASDEFAALRVDPDWVQAWSEWIEHAGSPRTKAKVPGGPRAKVIFRQAVRAGPAVHVLAIQAAMANNWQGINPDWLRDGPELKAAKAKAAKVEARRASAAEAAASRLAEIEAGGLYAKGYLDIERRGDESNESVIERMRAFVHANQQPVEVS